MTLDTTDEDVTLEPDRGLVTIVDNDGGSYLASYPQALPCAFVIIDDPCNHKLSGHQLLCACGGKPGYEARSY